jgi:Transglutaminase-like superfamily
MCFTLAKILPHDRWNWDGDRIVHECIVPSSRPVPGYLLKKSSYDIDVREFLVTERNEVMRRTLRVDIKSFVQTTPGANWGLFQSRSEGSFDHRAHLIAAFVAETIKYKAAFLDYWQFPDETLWVKEGDCEDRALLMASLLLASGVSGHNVRVALGKLRVSKKSGKRREYDHAWVMYKTEDGRWTLLEPLQLHREAKGAFHPETPSGLAQAEYVPYFVFNDVHLWEVIGPEARPSFQDVALRRRWSRIHPRFAGEVHHDLLAMALQGHAPDWYVRALQSRFTKIPFVGLVDNIDRVLCDYDPRDHFDNGYVDDGWNAANGRLETFRSKPLTDPGATDAFARAAHAIADFYAHSSYMHFAGPVVGPKPYDPGNLPVTPGYGPGSSFDLMSGKFSMNTHIFGQTPADAAKYWNRRLISGRYAQPRDTQPGWANAITEGMTFIPKELLKAKDFKYRGGLPHHNEIAVDREYSGRNKSHKLYRDSWTYNRQFDWRKQAATEHIRAAYSARGA